MTTQAAPIDEKAREAASPSKRSLKDRIIRRVNQFQLRHKWAGFAYAVQKKYGDDETGYQAALITYYGFLSLFPLLIVALSLTQLSLFHDANLKSQIVTSLNQNFPIVGAQLQNNVHATQKAGIALIISIILTLYGARGVAAALQNVMNHIWQVPKFRRGGFAAQLKSIVIVLLIAVGFLFSGVLSSYATSPKSDIALKIAAIAVSLLLIYVVLLMIFKLSLSVKHKIKTFLVGSLLAAAGFQIVQVLGGFLITHELSKLSSLYGTFAVILAILFWIYLLSRIMLYATEVDTVRGFKLWPRSLTDHDLTPADKKALKMYIGRERYMAPPKEELTVDLK